MWLRARRARPPRTLCRSRADSTLQPTEMGAPPEDTGGVLCLSALRAGTIRLERSSAGRARVTISFVCIVKPLKSPVWWPFSTLQLYLTECVLSVLAKTQLVLRVIMIIALRSASTR